ncbi:MAG: P-loop NTPase family protein [Candidatus Limnocylindrales bacterium]
MPAPSLDVTAALATLRDRWGAAAPQRIDTSPDTVTVGALATVLLPDAPRPGSAPVSTGNVVSTGFAALDAILVPGGVPRHVGLSLRGDHSSGKTTLALRLVAEAQASGSIVAWLDLARGLDPVEAVARGVRLEWLVVLTPASLDEGLSMAGQLLQGRAVDLLVADLAVERPPGGGHRPHGGTADRIHRLAALARRAGTLLVILQPPGLPGHLTNALAESTGLHLELVRRSWIRLGRDIVGQRTEVAIVRDRSGPPGRRAEVRILYAEGGEADRRLGDERLLRDMPLNGIRPISTAPVADAPIPPILGTSTHAPPPPPLAASPPPARPVPLRLVPAGAGDPRWSAVDARDRARRESGRPSARRPKGDVARERPAARP